MCRNTICHTLNDHLIHLIEAPDEVVAIIGAHLCAVVAHASFQHWRVPINMSLTICHALYFMNYIHDMLYTMLFVAVVAHASFQRRRVPIDMSLTICHTLYISCTIRCIHDMSYTILFRAVVAHATLQQRRVPFDTSLTICQTLYYLFSVCHTLYYSAQ